MEKVNFHYIGVLLDMMYGINMDEDELEELGLAGWELIGNKTTRTYHCKKHIDSNNSIKLPCNASSIEAVTLPYEDYNSSNKYDYGDIAKANIELNIEYSKYIKSPSYISGKLIPYELVGDTLYFASNYGTVNILYKGIIADEDGLPELSNKEAVALATYLAYVSIYKEWLLTNNEAKFKQSETLRRLWLQLCDLARVTSLSQNAMQEILDVKGSWDRPNYGFSYKYKK